MRNWSSIGAPLIAVDAAVDDDNVLGTAEEQRDLLVQIAQGVAMFGEEHQLAAVAVFIDHVLAVLQQGGQLQPLLIMAAVALFVGHALQAGQGIDFSLQFVGRQRRGGAIENLFFQFFRFLGRGLVEILPEGIVEVDGTRHRRTI